MKEVELKIKEDGLFEEKKKKKTEKKGDRQLPWEDGSIRVECPRALIAGSFYLGLVIFPIPHMGTWKSSPSSLLPLAVFDPNLAALPALFLAF